MKRSVRSPIVLLLFFFFLLGSHCGIAGEVIELHTFKTHSRFQIQLDEGVPVIWKSSSQGFELTLKGVGLVDLGASFGDEEKWKNRFSDLTDIRVHAIRIEENPGEVKITGKWKFPLGKLALAHPEMEFFEFRNKNPARYVVDFWVKAGRTLTQVKADQKQKEFQEILRKTKDDEKKRITRRLASERRHAEAENTNRFCEQPLDEKNDVFLEFYPLHQEVDFKRWFSATTADAQFPYYRPKKKSKDAQYVRLALKFYSEGKLGLAVRTIDFLDAEFPRTEFQAEMRFLRANALIKLGLREKGEQLLSAITTDLRETPVALYSGMYLAGRAMEKKSTLEALDRFLWLIQHYPDHRLAWVFHLGAAECFYYMKQTERANQEYEWVIEKSSLGSQKAEGAFRQGDLYQARSQYEQALGSYSQGFRYFEEEAINYPTFYLNRAEALYQLQDYERAKSEFKKFIKEYPNHSEGWRATFRLGEILARKSKLEEARQEFYTTINRYPVSPGATLARLRLVPCGDHGGFNREAQIRFFSQEAAVFDGQGVVHLKNYADLRALARVRSLISLGTDEETSDAAIEELQKVKFPHVKQIISHLGSHFFQKVVTDMLQAGKKYEALTYYQSKSDHVPPPEAAIDAEYLISLSQAASDLGLGSLAKEIDKDYEKNINIQKKSANRSLASKKDGLEDLQDLESQLKISEKNYSVAKALWVSQLIRPEAEEYPKIRQLLEQVRDESRFSYEKEIILGLMDQKSGGFRSALNHAARAELMSRNPRIQYWVASLHEQAGEVETALKIYQQLESKIAKRSESVHENTTENMPKDAPKNTPKNTIEELLGVPIVPTLDALILSEGQAYEKLGKWGEAASTYSRAIEKGLGGNQARFEYARSLIQSKSPEGQIQAMAVLEKLANETSSDGEGKKEFWRRLAQETLEDEKSKRSIGDRAKEGKK